MCVSLPPSLCLCISLSLSVRLFPFSLSLSSSHCPSLSPFPPLRSLRACVCKSLLELQCRHDMTDGHGTPDHHKHTSYQDRGKIGGNLYHPLYRTFVAEAALDAPVPWHRTLCIASNTSNTALVEMANSRFRNVQMSVPC